MKFEIVSDGTTYGTEVRIDGEVVPVSAVMIRMRIPHAQAAGIVKTYELNIRGKNQKPGKEEGSE